MYGHTKSITSIAVSKDQKYLWTTDSNGHFRIWDTIENRCIKHVNTEKNRINAMAIIGSDVWLGFMDGLQIRNSADGSLIKEFPGFPVFSMAVVNDSLWIGDTGKFVIFSLDGPQETISFENGLTPVIFTQVGKESVWVASTDRKISIFDLSSKIFFQEFDTQHTSRITSVVLVDQLSVWSTSDDGHIIVWDATTGDMKEKLPSKHNSKVFGAIPFGDQVWSFSWNGQVHIWDRQTAIYRGSIADLNSDAVAAIQPIWSDALGCWKVFTAGWDRSVSIWLAKGEPLSPPVSLPSELLDNLSLDESSPSSFDAPSDDPPEEPPEDSSSSSSSSSSSVLGSGESVKPRRSMPARSV